MKKQSPVKKFTPRIKGQVTTKNTLIKSIFRFGTLRY